MFYVLVCLFLINSLLLLPELLLHAEQWQVLPHLEFNSFALSFETLYGLFLETFLRRSALDLGRLNLELGCIWLLVVYAKFSTKPGFMLLASFYLTLLTLTETYRHGFSFLTLQDPLEQNHWKFAARELTDFSNLNQGEQGLLICLSVLAIAAGFFMFYKLLSYLQQVIKPHRHRKAVHLLSIFLIVHPLFLISWYGIRNDASLARAPSATALQLVWNTWRTPEVKDQEFHTAALEQHRSFKAILQNPKSIRPNIHLLFIESYGTILTQNPRLRDQYFKLLDQLERDLTRNAWQISSTLTTAPVFGGQSWLSVASSLIGRDISTQEQWGWLVDRHKKVSSLVSDMQSLGFVTVGNFPSLDTLQDQAEFTDLFGFDHILTRKQFQYQKSEHMIARDIPDQYSLHFTYQNLLEKQNQPFLQVWLGYSSHPPWTKIPPFLDDWTQMKDIHKPAEPLSLQDIWQGFRFKFINKYLSDGFLSEQTEDHYIRAIYYSLTSIQQYIQLTGQQNDIYIVLGDHQPRLNASRTYGLQTPIHIISPAALGKAWIPIEKGFRQGFHTPNSVPISHQQIRELVQRILLNLNKGSLALKPKPPHQPIITKKKQTL